MINEEIHLSAKKLGFCKRVENLTRHTNSLFSGHTCFMDTVAFMTHDVLLLNNN